MIYTFLADISRLDDRPEHFTFCEAVSNLCIEETSLNFEKFFSGHFSSPLMTKEVVEHISAAKAPALHKERLGAYILL